MLVKGVDLAACDGGLLLLEGLVVVVGVGAVSIVDVAIKNPPTMNTTTPNASAETNKDAQSSWWRGFDYYYEGVLLVRIWGWSFAVVVALLMFLGRWLGAWGLINLLTQLHILQNQLINMILILSNARLRVYLPGDRVKFAFYLFKLFIL